jgi:Carboxypeptidase regulatory-like domain
MFLPRLRRRLYFLPILLAAVAALSSGCMWGVVTDATTGAPIAGAKVTLTDKSGQSVTVQTDGQGVFNFSQASLAPLAFGEADCGAAKTGYGAVSQPFLLDTLSPFPMIRHLKDFELARGSFAYWHDKYMHLSLLFPAGWTIDSQDYSRFGGTAWAPGTIWGSANEKTFCTMTPFPITGGSLRETIFVAVASDVMFGLNPHGAAPVDTKVRGLPAVRTTIVHDDPPGISGNPEPWPLEDLVYVIGLNDTQAYFIACQTRAAKYRQWEPKFEAIVHSLETGR